MMPHFAVEVAGEANPMNDDLVFQTLQQATGSNPQLVQVASVQLANWETQSGYYSALQNVYANLNYDQSIRFQAIIQLKNGIDKYWRKTSSHVIDKQEKLKIRSKAIQAGIEEPVAQLGLQNSLMLAKIVRYEFPHEWPDVMTVLINHLREPRNECQAVINVLNLTLHVVKELSTARLQRSRTSLKVAAPELFHVLGALYIVNTNKWIPLLLNGLNTTALFIDTMLLSLASLKAIRRVLVAGFEHPHRDSEPIHFWVIFQRHFGEFWFIAKSEPVNASDKSPMKLVAKHLVQLSKLHLDMARTQPASFVLFPGCASVLQTYWSLVRELGKRFSDEASSQHQNDWHVQESGDNVDDLSIVEKLALKGLLLFRAILKMAFNPVQTFKYQQPQDKHERMFSVEIIRSNVLAEPMVVEMLEILVTQFFVLRPSDFREWGEEPTEWEKREDEITEAWEFSLRSCSEKLFFDLIINYKDVLVPRLLDVFYRYASPENGDVFLKDSIYTAVGIAAPALYSKFDFNKFLRNTLRPEAQVQGANYNILRRRIAILLGQWMPIISSRIEKPVVYQIFAGLLRMEALNDQVVRVTAGRQLRPVLEPFEFSYEDFAPYARTIFESLMTLIRETDLVETKMALLETVRVAVERMEAHVEPFTDDIMSMLSPLWQASSEEHLMKQAILTMITTIVTALSRQSLKYQGSIVPLIRDSIEPNSETLIYLLEEALGLWLAMIQQTPSSDPSPSEDLLSLSSGLLPLLDLGSESLRKSLNILESYILISPTTVLMPSFLTPLLSSLSLLMGSQSTGFGSARREISRITQLMETLIKTLSVPRHFPDRAMQLQAGQHLIENMVEASFLQSLLSLLKEAYDYHQDPRPSRPTPAIIGPGETELFSVLARIAFLSPNLLIEAVSAAGGVNSAAWLVTEWIIHFDNIGDIYRKKLHAIAITSLYSISSPPPQFMLEQLQSMMTMWTDIITELGQDASEDSKGDYLWQASNDSEPSAPASQWAQRNEAPEEERRREVVRVEPVSLINIRELVARTMQSVSICVGGPEVLKRTWLSRIDGAVLDAFFALGLM